MTDTPRDVAPHTADAFSLSLSRRRVLQAIGVTSAIAALPPFIRTSNAAEPLRISTFGGAFGQSFSDHFFPAFTKDTGITVQRVEQPSGTQFLLQLGQANAAGTPPMDLCMAVDAQVLRGRARGLWREIDSVKLSKAAALGDPYVRRTDKGIDGVAAMAYFMTLVVNPTLMDPLPDSWSVLWDKHPNFWGIQSGGSSPMLEIAANLYFGGNAILETHAGIDKVLAKVKEIKPNVKLWWQDEGTMQTALQNEELVGGTYVHDTAIYLQQNGTSVRSIFPREGAVQGINYWCQPSSSKRTHEVEAFLEWSCSSKAQEIIALKMNSAPILSRSQLALSDAQFALVSSEGTPIYIATEARMKNAEYLEQQFTRMLMESA
jgi:putative spermidine/putrescine transport system substrate-binding protein